MENDLTRLPSGTVTFMFTDIEGSTHLAQELGDSFSPVMEDHLQLSRQALKRHEGHEIRTTGDGFFAVFTDAYSAVQAALDLHRSFAEFSWPEGEDVRIRIGLHTGRGTPGGDDYVGLDVHRAARIADAAHGGQLVISDATRSIVEHDLPTELTLQDLGEHQLKDLAHREHLHQVSGPGLDTDFPPLRSLSSVNNNLPGQITSFVGRDDELGKVADLLQSQHLVTLTGPAGIGKTRLAIECGATIAPEFPDGVFLVELASERQAEMVPSVITNTLQLGRKPEESSSVSDDLAALGAYFADRKMLLILDNLEQVSDSGPLIADLLGRARRLRVIATSRTPLRIRGEQEFPLGPLQLPESAEDSVEALSRVEALALFEDRARTVVPDFRLDEDNIEPVLRIARLLDGLPLAVELAALRLRYLSPTALAERIEQDLQVLGRGPEDLPPRQRTLEAAIRWSYELLEEPQQRLFRYFAVFSGGANLEAITEICGELTQPVADVEALVNQGLLQADRGGEEPRFRMLEPVRWFADKLLGETGERSRMVQNHARYFLDFALRDEASLTVSSQALRMERLGMEHDNLRAALQRAISLDDADTALTLVGSLWRYWQIRGLLNEARSLIDQALALDGGSPQARLRGLEASGSVAYWRGEAKASRVAYEKALELARSEGSTFSVPNALYNLGFALALGDESDVERSKELFEDSLRLSEEADDTLGVGKGHYGLGFVSLWSGRHEVAQHHLEKALKIFRDLDAYFLIAASVGVMGGNLQAMGRHEDALETLRKGIRIRFQEGNVSSAVVALKAMAVSEAALGRNERALLLLGAAKSLIGTSGTDFAEHFPDPPGLLERVPAEEAEALMAEGRAMSFEDVVGYALDTPED